MKVLYKCPQRVDFSRLFHHQKRTPAFAPEADDPRFS